MDVSVHPRTGGSDARPGSPVTSIIRPPEFNRPGLRRVTPAAQAAFRSRPPVDDWQDPRASLLLGSFLAAWLTDVVRLSVRPKTFVSYESIVRIHLAPALGSIGLSDLRPGECSPT
jgi:hypothetical protein